MDGIYTSGIRTDSSKTRRRVGIILSALPVAFLIFDSVMKLMKVPYLRDERIRALAPWHTRDG